jgi:hypothetical protein
LPSFFEVLKTHNSPVDIPLGSAQRIGEVVPLLGTRKKQEAGIRNGCDTVNDECQWMGPHKKIE